MARDHEFPRMRPVEAKPSRLRPGAFDLTDPSGLAPHTITLSAPTLFIASKMNGRRCRADIQAEFTVRHGSLLFSEELDQLITQLDDALFLQGPTLDAHVTGLTAQYRSLAARPIRDEDAFGAPVDRLGAYLDKLLGAADASCPCDNGRVLGLVAPHLDYARGGPCYAAAYRDLAGRTDAKRFIILGTNHFGRGSAVVGTRKDFETPFGTVPQDVDFLQRIEKRLGADLCEFERDHLREHSIELQAILLRHLLGDRECSILTFLCPDPCGPSGTAPHDGCGVDLKDFAMALRDEVNADATPTCLIAAADLSHVGRFFQDDRSLDTESLRAVEESDRRALDHILAADPEALRSAVTKAGNATNICSVGCIYTVSAVLKERATPRLLHYHQAVTPEAENCVTCAALEFTPS